MKTTQIPISAGLACVCALAAVARAQESAPPASDAPIINMIELCADRRVRQMSRFYPPAAVQNNVRGEVQLDCAFTADETLQTCQIVEETPAGHGFGVAALAATCHHPRKPSEITGSDARVYTPEGSDRVHVRWRVRFDVQGG